MFDFDVDVDVDVILRIAVVGIRKVGDDGANTKMAGYSFHRRGFSTQYDT